MKFAFQRLLSAFCLIVLLSGYIDSIAQSSSKSLLINHGTDGCNSSTAQQHFFAGTLTSNPVLIASGNIGISSNNSLASYNPADHKVYFAYMHNNITDVYALDFNFAGNITFPTVSSPTYTYSYQLSQLCFDNSGNNYVFLNFDASSGTAHMAQADITTGNLVAGSDRLVRFPSDNIPNSVGWGDIVILPNGRMFAVFGNSPSKLFELTNINGTGDINAVFLTNMPRPCFSIGFVDGGLTIAGSDSGGCYYYNWDINSFSLGASTPFPLSKGSSDMSNLTVAVGCSKELIAMNMINTNTAIVYYRIVVKNKGNIYLNNIQVTDNLANAFGAGKFSNISVSFDSNPANLLLNTNYDGINDINLLAPNQMLNNYPSNVDSVVINLTATVKDFVQNQVYNNSAVVSGNIGSGSNYLAVSDSSNNGDATKIDLDGNGVSDDLGENVPTPVIFSSVLAVQSLALHGSLNNDVVDLGWKGIAEEKILNYQVQRSLDGKSFETIKTIEANGATIFELKDIVTHLNQSSLYYRIQVNKQGGTALSNTIMIRKKGSLALSSYPNPFSGQLNVQVYTSEKTSGILSLKDITGRLVYSKNIQLENGGNYITINEAGKLSPGTYVLEVNSGAEKQYLKMIKK